MRGVSDSTNRAASKSGRAQYDAPSTVMDFHNDSASSIEYHGSTTPPLTVLACHHGASTAPQSPSHLIT